MDSDWHQTAQWLAIERPDLLPCQLANHVYLATGQIVTGAQVAAALRPVKDADTVHGLQDSGLCDL